MPGAIVSDRRVSCHVEMFSDVVIIDEGGQRHIVQLCQSWWLHEDGSYCVAVHRCDDPLINDGSFGNDPERRRYLDDRYEQLRRLALGIAGVTVLLLGG